MSSLNYRTNSPMAERYRDMNGIGGTTVWRESVHEWFPVEHKADNPSIGLCGPVCRTKREATQKAQRMADIMRVPFTPLPNGADFVTIIPSI